MNKEAEEILSYVSKIYYWHVVYREVGVCCTAVQVFAWYR